ncbi:hypothetical protein B0H14DRAFT_2414290, partial [Mycena olivaceomarginata]
QVAVVGAGVSGLTAAAHSSSSTATVSPSLSAEESRSARFQGGSLDIHPKTGQAALELAGLTKEFRALARPEGEEMRIVDKHATTHHADDGARDRPEVIAGSCARSCLDSLDAGTVAWGSAVQSAEIPKRGRSTASKLFDAIIGADGAWSQHPLCPQPRQARVHRHRVHRTEHNGRRQTATPRSRRSVGQGTLHALQDKKALIPQRKQWRATSCTYAWLPVPLSWPEDNRHRVHVARGRVGLPTRERLLGLVPTSCSRCLTRPPRLPLRRCSASYPVRSLFALPSPHAWETFPGGRITIVGDAAHLSFPNGEGANLAMLDGAEVALAIASARDSAMLGRKHRRVERAG